MDPHGNVFYYYRGPAKYKSDEMQIDKQLENNTTKALINVLQHSPPGILSTFLDLIGSKTRYTNFPVPQRNNYRFALQRIPELAKSAGTKVVATISKDLSQKSGESPGGKPDAFIYSPRSLAIMIESKLKGMPSEGQIEGHLQQAGWEKSDVHQCNLTWKEIYNSMGVVKHDFLVGQFRQYLEVIGMASFAGFVDDDFNFFISYDDDYRPLLRNKIEQFGQEVYQGLLPHIRDVYPDFQVANIVKGREAASVNLRKHQEKHDAFKHCNFSIAIRSEGLQFNAVIREGKWNNKRMPIGHFYQKLLAEPGRVETLLRGFDGNFYVAIYRRLPLHGSKLMPGNELWDLKARLYLDFVNQELIKYLTRMLKEIDYPGLHVGREIRRGEPILSQGDQLIAEARTIFEHLYGILQYLEKKD
jgi:hypothetical protein